MVKLNTDVNISTVVPKGKEFTAVALLKNFDKFNSGSGFLVYDGARFNVFDTKLFDYGFRDVDIPTLDLKNFNVAAKEEVKNNNSRLYKTIKLALIGGYCRIGILSTNLSFNDTIDADWWSKLKLNYKLYRDTCKIRYEGREVTITHYDKDNYSLKGSNFDFFIVVGEHPKKIVDDTKFNTRLGDNPMWVTI